jgi:hypothetical protein
LEGKEHFVVSCFQKKSFISLLLVALGCVLA